MVSTCFLRRSGRFGAQQQDRRKNGEQVGGGKLGSGGEYGAGEGVAPGDAGGGAGDAPYDPGGLLGLAGERLLAPDRVDRPAAGGRRRKQFPAQNSS